MKKLGGLLLAGCLVLQASGGQAGKRARNSEVAPPTALTINQEVGAVRELRLETGQNRLLVLSQAVGRVSVAEPDVADLKVVTPTQLLLTARGVGTTDLTLWDKADSPLVIALTVTRNLESLRTQIKSLFPGENIEVSTAGDLVVLTGEVSDVRVPERLTAVAKLHTEKLANLVRVGGNQQVMLEVKFAEVSRSGLREMGINFYHDAADYRTEAGMFSSRTRPNVFLPDEGRRPLGAAGGHPPSIPGPTFGDAFSIFFSSFSRFPFSVMLSMLEGRGLAKMLAEPSLVTLSGQEAKFLAGGELPIPFSSSLGQVSVNWKEFGIKLRFTPTVTGKESIHLKLAAEVSDLDVTSAVTVGGFTIPSLVSRQSETTVRLGDGQSFAIAGLLSDQISSEIEEVPFLGRIPVLGALFRSTAFQREETELLVIVTARLARPVAPHELPPLPTDYEQNDVGDLELFFLGWESETPPTERGGEEHDRHESASDDRGPSGFVGFMR